MKYPTDATISPLIRLGVTAVGCIVCGLCMIIFSQTSSIPKSVDNLSRIEGPMTMETGTRVRRRTITNYPVLVMGGRKYTYPEWFPRADTLPEQLRSGETVKIWSDADNNNWIWQIERQGETIVSFAEIRETVVNSRKSLGIGGFVVVFIGIGFAIFLVIKTRPYWEVEQERSSSPQRSKKKKSRKKPTRLKELPEDD